MIAVETLLDKTIDVDFREEIADVAQDVMETVTSAVNHMIMTGKLCEENINKLLVEEYEIMLKRIMIETDADEEENKIIKFGNERSIMAHGESLKKIYQGAIVRRISRRELSQL